MIDVARGRRVGEYDEPAVPCCGHTNFFGPLRPAGGALAAWTSGDASFWLDGAGIVQQLAASEAVALGADGTTGFFLQADGNGDSHLVRLDLAKREPLTELESGTSSDRSYLSPGAVASADGNTAVDSRITSRCVHSPDRPDTCIQQVWDLASYSAGAPRSLGESTQPLTPRWVSNAGVTLLEGSLQPTPLPSIAASGTVPAPPYGLHLVDAHGTRLATFDLSPQELIHTAAGPLLIGYDSPSHDYQLTAIDVASASARSLFGATGVTSIEDHAIVAEGSRVVVIARETAGEGVTSTTLWAGRIAP